ncbi:protein TsetseEP-like isoform X1 [Micropterus dolomieu]|uniref:protein TsetseEP-like isoform X1 n=1 Tax=Micropterus dolomieu TaxID=147949 RepID=UPI001E8E5F25|nr:protein TsetseEP-like isoform X1 [Micropterus dolomieu]
MRKAYNFVLIKEGNSTTTLLDPHPQAQPDPRPQAQPDPRPEAQPDPHPEAQPDPHPQAQPDPRPQAQPDPHPEAQEKETFYILDLHPVSLPVKEQPPPKKRKCKLTVVLAHYV